MKLTKKEKAILTLLDEAIVDMDELVKWIVIYVRASREEIEKAVNKFRKAGFIKVLEAEDKLLYFHTGKVTAAMMDRELDYKLKYGLSPHITTASESLEAKVGFKKNSKKHTKNL